MAALSQLSYSPFDVEVTDKANTPGPKRPRRAGAAEGLALTRAE